MKINLKLIGGFVLVIIWAFVTLKFSNGELHQLDPIDPASITGEYDYSKTEGTFHGSLVSVPPFYKDTALSSVLGDNNEQKRIEVDLTNQRVYAFENDRKVYEFTVSTGKWYPTPTGTFRIWGKSRFQKMSGGSRALGTYYYLPNIPYIMWFSGGNVSAARGFSFHGTYWHNNFGNPMSHGCINMRTEDAEKLYYWSSPNPGNSNTPKATKDNPGTLIVIYGTTPKR
ncbi:L,D-transpeptidase [Candidatus Curtissbacteria bacterium]|nr:L,D-transpeptidase [Candidatus Curtissbacteria bacterium]